MCVCTVVSILNIPKKKISLKLARVEQAFTDVEKLTVLFVERKKVEEKNVLFLLISQKAKDTLRKSILSKTDSNNQFLSVSLALSLSLCVCLLLNV